MKLSTILTLTILLLLAACQGITSPAAMPAGGPGEQPELEEPSTTPASIKLTCVQAEEDSILPVNDWTTLNGRYQDPGAVIYHDSRFHMFYNSSNTYPPDVVHIGYAVSSDGYTWERISEESLIKEEDIPYEVESILAGAVIVEPDGTWVLYFYTRDDLSASTTSRIGRATASNPLGPWIVDPDPVLLPDPKGWASTALQRPDVIRIGDSYYMVFVGTGEENTHGMIGLATSSDGIVWQKYNNPETVDKLFAISDPVLSQVEIGQPDAYLKYPRLRLTSDGWLLFYQTNAGSGRDSCLWLAESMDGVNWRQIQDEPILAYDEIPGVSTIFLPNVVFHDDTYFIYVELSFGSNSRINLVTHKGAFFPDDDRAGVPDPNLPDQLVDPKGIPMQLVPAGSFTMGDDSSGNSPIHTVILRDYYLDEYEVSNASFADFLNEMGNQVEGGVTWLDAGASADGYLHEQNGVWTPDEGYADHPVVEVTWFGASAYCTWREARLPTEAEWEKAARGTDARVYPWGEALSCEEANYRSCNLGVTLPIDSHPESLSPYGIYNLAGNASEWTRDTFAAYSSRLEINPFRDSDSDYSIRVVRGGSWYSEGVFLSSYHRNSEFIPQSSFPNLGFRCAQCP